MNEKNEELVRHLDVLIEECNQGTPATLIGLAELKSIQEALSHRPAAEVVPYESCDEFPADTSQWAIDHIIALEAEITRLRSQADNGASENVE